MKKLVYKYWDQFWSKYVTVEAGFVIGDEAMITNPNILPLGKMALSSIPWWDKDGSGFCLVD